MPDVERKLPVLRDFHLPDENAFGERAAGIVFQNLGDAAEFVQETSNSGVGGADHRAPGFDGSENSVGEVLFRAA